MKNYFSYSLLQYKHSLILGEALNIGILFYFPNEKLLQFSFGNSHRIKAVYPDFDLSLFNSLVNTFKRKLVDSSNIFINQELHEGLKSYIQNYLSSENSSALQFSDPVISKNTFLYNQDTINHYSRQLLPGIITERPSVIKHNEHFIIKEYIGYVIEKDRNLERKIQRNKEISVEGMIWKFDVAWEFDSLNLVKPVSFDLTDELTIQSKSAYIHGLLSVLNTYSVSNNCRFDLLFSKPRDRKLFKVYDNAVKIIDSAKSPKRIIEQNNWPSYFEETVNSLLQ